jgi:hypothetical protein
MKHALMRNLPESNDDGFDIRILLLCLAIQKKRMLSTRTTQSTNEEMNNVARA